MILGTLVLSCELDSVTTSFEWNHIVIKSASSIDGVAPCTTAYRIWHNHLGSQGKPANSHFQWETYFLGSESVILVDVLRKVLSVALGISWPNIHSVNNRCVYWLVCASYSSWTQIASMLKGIVLLLSFHHVAKKVNEVFLQNSCPF